MLNAQLGLGSEARCMKVSFINITMDNISHENTLDNLTRDHLLKKEGDLGKEVRNSCMYSPWIKEKKTTTKTKRHIQRCVSK